MQSVRQPPAQVDRGWYAGFVAARNSVCLGGKLLGPWTDGNGDARYACLYEPAHKGEGEPIPMLVFLHPSETSAYSVILTGLVGLIDKGVLTEGHPGFILLAPQGRYATMSLLDTIRTRSGGTTGTGSWVSMERWPQGVRPTTKMRTQLLLIISSTK